ncbi:MAG: GFA family protein [Pseudomonadota bacterium]
MYKGSCRCGAVRFKVQRNARFQLICQCTRCQEMTGAGHAPIMIFKDDGFELTGTPVTHAYTAASGNVVTHHFCGECGSPLFNRNSQFSSAVYVIAGALDDPTAFTPQRVIFTAEAQAWDKVPDDLPKFEGMPTR